MRVGGGYGAEPSVDPPRDPCDLVYAVLLLLLFIGPATRASAWRGASGEQTHISRSAPRLLSMTVLSQHARTCAHTHTRVLS